eukprot:GFUD01008985.1.p1 GENE.GFUD01008985.1~~GFUD01008985.1.p1  ORF type:complete len:881 (-),score=182.76 GFUD01008985.1:190-2832(-)
MSLTEACASLVEALDARRTDIVKSLLDHLSKTGEGCETDIQSVLSCLGTKHGTVLHYAVQADLTDAIRALLLSGADPGISNEGGKTALAMVVENPSLLQVFADELLRAVAASNCKRIEVLLDAGVKIDSVDSVLTKNSALHWAASFGSKEVVDLLLHRGADINAANADGCTALHDAVQRKDAAIVKKLLDAGADVSFVATNGKLRGKTPKELSVKMENIYCLFKDSEESLVEGLNSTNENLQSLPTLHIPVTTASVHAPIQVTSTLLATEIASNTSAGVVKDEKLNLLWPQPQHLHQLEGEPVTIPPHLHLVISSLSHGHTLHSVLDVWQVHREELNEIGHTASIKGVDQPGNCLAGVGEIEINVCEDLDNNEYNISLTSARIRIRAGGDAGMHYAIVTLMQIFWIFRGSRVPQIIVRDKPEMAVRGILVDMAAYGRLPTLETFTSTIRTLSKLKMNQVHLYMRLSPQVEWQLPFLPNDLIAMDRECHDRRIQVFPTLDIIQPCSFAELKNYTPAFSQIISCFSSRGSIHIGPCLSSIIISTAAQSGPEGVFPVLPGVLSVGASTRIIICNNSLSNYANLLDNLPSNIGLVEYGFQGDYPFLQNALSNSRSGCQQIFCPGTSAWNCLVGRPLNMANNISNAAKAAKLTNAAGLIVASWAGSPALAPVASSFPGWALGLGLAWNSSVKEEYVSRYLGDILSKHLFYDETGNSGQIILDLGRSEACVESPKPLEPGSNVLQTSLLLNVIMRPNGVDLENTSADQLGKVIQELRRNLTKLQVSREGGGGSGEGIIQEIALSGELLLLAARLARGLILTEERNIAALQPTFRTDLANKLLSLTEQYRAVWLSRYQPSGMQTSLLHLTCLLNLLLPQDSQYMQAV